MNNKCNHELLVKAIIDSSESAVQCPLCYAFFPFGYPKDDIKRETITLWGWVIPGSQVDLEIKELLNKSKNLKVNPIEYVKMNEASLNSLSTPVKEFVGKSRTLEKGNK